MLQRNKWTTLTYKSFVFLLEHILNLIFVYNHTLQAFVHGGISKCSYWSNPKSIIFRSSYLLLVSLEYWRDFWNSSINYKICKKVYLQLLRCQIEPYVSIVFALHVDVAKSSYINHSLIFLDARWFRTLCSFDKLPRSSSTFTFSAS